MLRKHFAHSIGLLLQRQITVLITFRVSRRREMYIGHERLSVCPRPHAHTTGRTQMQLGGWCGVYTPSCALLGGFAIAVHGLRCYGNIVRTRNVSECLY